MSCSEASQLINSVSLRCPVLGKQGSFELEPGKKQKLLSSRGGSYLSGHADFDADPNSGDTTLGCKMCTRMSTPWAALLPRQELWWNLNLSTLENGFNWPYSLLEAFGWKLVVLGQVLTQLVRLCRNRTNLVMETRREPCVEMKTEARVGHAQPPRCPRWMPNC